MPEWQVFHQIRCNVFEEQLRFWDNAMQFVRVCTIDFTDAVDIPFIEKSAGIARHSRFSLDHYSRRVVVFELLYSDFVTPQISRFGN